MKIDVERICNGMSAPYWYGVCFFVENGKPNMVEGRLPSSVTETKEQGERTKASLVASMENFVKERGFVIPSYPDKDKRLDSSQRSRKRGMSPTQVANEALKRMGSIVGDGSVDNEQLARMIELARKAGYFFPKPPQP